MGMRIEFLGGTGTVTGSKFLLAHGGRQLLVDCGLFQGLKALRLRNWEPLPLAVHGLDAVLLSHAHLDHSGHVPRLVRQGFAGPVFCSEATAELCALLWPDSGRLQEEQADFVNRRGATKHHPALPLYTEADARAALSRLVPLPFDRPHAPWPLWRWTLTRAGHILGAASALVEALDDAGRAVPQGRVLFSGDLGRDDDLMMRGPAPPPAADTVLIESTYGDREHPAADALAELADVVCRTAARGGVVVIPAFAVGRAQTLLHALARLKHERRIPDLPVFLNSPMAADATRLLERHHAEHRLDAAQLAAFSRVAKIVNSVEESRGLNAVHWPSVIVSASGMATGGRVLHHLKHYLPEARNTVLFAGYQAAGTRGASLVGGATAVKIFGEWVPVRAEVANLAMLSAHADRSGLLGWLAKLPHAPRQVFAVHGEPQAAEGLCAAIGERFGWNARVPADGERVEL